MSPAESSCCPPRRRTAQLATGLRYSVPRRTNQTPSSQCVTPRPPSIRSPVVMSMMRALARHYTTRHLDKRCRATRSVRQTRRSTVRGRRPRVVKSSRLGRSRPGGAGPWCAIPLVVDVADRGAAGQLVGSQERRDGHASRPAHASIDQTMERHVRGRPPPSHRCPMTTSRSRSGTIRHSSISPETCEPNKIVYVDDDAGAVTRPCWQWPQQVSPRPLLPRRRRMIASCCTCAHASTSRSRSNAVRGAPMSSGAMSFGCRVRYADRT